MNVSCYIWQDHSARIKTNHLNNTFNAHFTVVLRYNTNERCPPFEHTEFTINTGYIILHRIPSPHHSLNIHYAEKMFQIIKVIDFNEIHIPSKSSF
jgi:hypothetical protein